MHERAVLNDLMNKINALSAQSGATRVLKISVQLGALSHMSEDHFKEHFSDAALGSIAEYAEVEAFQSTDIHDPHANGIILKKIDVV